MQHRTAQSGILPSLMQDKLEVSTCSYGPDPRQETHTPQLDLTQPGQTLNEKPRPTALCSSEVLRAVLFPRPRPLLSRGALRQDGLGLGRGLFGEEVSGCSWLWRWTASRHRASRKRFTKKSSPRANRHTSCFVKDLRT